MVRLTHRKFFPLVRQPLRPWKGAATNALGMIICSPVCAQGWLGSKAKPRHGTAFVFLADITTQHNLAKIARQSNLPAVESPNLLALQSVNYSLIARASRAIWSEASLDYTDIITAVARKLVIIANALCKNRRKEATEAP